MKYEINEETVAIIPIGSNKTKVVELNDEYIVPQSSFSIMEENCEYYGSTYNGRIKAAQKILNYSYKLPLLVEESEKLIFFPTKASTDKDCAWINHNYVLSREKSGKNYTKVVFQNGIELEFKMLDVMVSRRIKQK